MDLFILFVQYLDIVFSTYPFIWPPDSYPCWDIRCGKFVSDIKYSGPSDMISWACDNSNLSVTLFGAELKSPEQPSCIFQEKKV